MTNLMNKLMNKLRNGLNDWELLLLAMFCMTMYTLAERGDRRVLSFITALCSCAFWAAWRCLCLLLCW